MGEGGNLEWTREEAWDAFWSRPGAKAATGMWLFPEFLSQEARPTRRGAVRKLFAQFLIGLFILFDVEL